MNANELADYEPCLNKGVALYQLRRYTEAMKAFEQAAETGHPNAREALEILKQDGAMKWRGV